jgi:hypothetical protein
MFDEIQCEVPLPDGGPAAATVFQTKSLPCPSLSRYRVTHDGRLLDECGRDLEPEGMIVIYANGPSPALLAAAPDHLTWWEYRLRFQGGRLAAIEPAKPGEPSNRYLGLMSFRWYASGPPADG